VCFYLSEEISKQRHATACIRATEPISGSFTAFLNFLLLNSPQMGLGKTLTAISVLWSFVRRGGCKGVIVCPSSLVDNWEKEIKKWMGVKLKALCVRSSTGTGMSLSSCYVSLCLLQKIQQKILFVKAVSNILFAVHDALTNIQTSASIDIDLLCVFILIIILRYDITPSTIAQYIFFPHILFISPYALGTFAQ
jgi:SNF2-related domain